MLLGELVEESKHEHPPRESWSMSWATSWDTVWADEFLGQWKSLALSPGGTPFFHPAVVRAWVEAFGGEERVQPFFLLAHGSHGTDILWPFVRLKPTWKRGYLKKLHPVGPSLFDYHDPLIRCKARGVPHIGPGFWTPFARQLSLLDGTSFDSFEIPRLRRHLVAGYARSCQTIDSAPFVRLNEYADSQVFLASRSRALREGVRRKFKRLRTLGNVEYVVYTSDRIGEVNEWIPDLERSRREKYPASRLPRNYLANLVKFGLPDSVVHCSAVALNGEPISWHIGFCCNETFYWYVPLYNTAYGKYSPGMLHTYLTFEWAIENGVEVFDFLRGLERYKSSWTDGEKSTMIAISHPASTMASRIRRFANRGASRGGRTVFRVRRAAASKLRQTLRTDH